MTLGIGGSTVAQELDRLEQLSAYQPITIDERLDRIAKAQRLMFDQGVDALFLEATTSLAYFTGLRLWASERLHGAIIPADGEVIYISPAFEEQKTRAMLLFGSDVRIWDEHEVPARLVADIVASCYGSAAVLAIDEAAPFFVYDALRQAAPGFDYVNGARITGPCRIKKSAAEVALIQHAMDITLEIQASAARIMREGITTTEVQQFLSDAHLKLGADSVPPFRIVLFGEPTAYPHGVPYPQVLQEGDMILIDVGATFDGYFSDITRSYVFGEPSQRQREIWDLEKKAQSAVFATAGVGVPAEQLDYAARLVIESAGLGPGYSVPGLPHRAGHGLGLDVHEPPYLVKGNKVELGEGMCFSNEPMICVYGEFGVRLEDHICITDDGPRWFTEPSWSIDNPFNLDG